MSNHRSVRGITAVLVACCGAATANDLVAISFPQTVTLSQSTAAGGPRSVKAPFDYSGIGNIINPSVALPGSGGNANDFTLHQTVGVVNITDVVVTYEYDAAVQVDAFDIVQHHNGVKTLELFIGNSLASMTSMGSVSVPENTIEYAVDRFDFDAPMTGRVVQLRLTEPELAGQGGWAMYRAFPVLVPGVGTLSLAGLGLGLISRRRRA